MAVDAPPLDLNLVNRVWVGLTSASRLERYYGRLAERFAFFNRLCLMSIAGLSVVAATLLFAGLPSWAPAIPALIVTVVSLWVSYADYSRKAGMAAIIASGCTDLGREWERLWNDLYVDDGREQAARLERQEDWITAPALLQQGFRDPKLHERCQKEAYEYCLPRYTDNTG